MKTIRTLTKLLLSVMIVITSLSVTALPVKAEPTDGTAYAVLTDDGDLVFCRSNLSYSDKVNTTLADINGTKYTGTVFTNIESGNHGWTEEGYNTLVKKVYVADNTIISPSMTSSMFASCTSLKEFYSKGFNTSNTVSMNSMFNNCSSLTMADVSYFKTQNVKSMVGMFSLCTSIKELDLTAFNTSKVSQMTAMFSNCSSLEKLHISNFNTSNVISMNMMFYACNRLNTITLGTGFTNWMNEAYLPTGNWTNGTITKTETELYNDYPSNALSLAGTWVKGDVGPVLVSELSIDKNNVDIFTRQTIQLTATVLPENASNKILSWSSSNPSIASVDQNGIVTGNTAGATVITVSTIDGSNLSQTCEITVTRAPEPTDGTAYAVLTSEGELIFLRSNNSYTDKDVVTVTDIYGAEYTGTVFVGVESGTFGWTDSSYNSLVKKVYVVDNTKVNCPSVLTSMYYGCSSLREFYSKGFNTNNTVSMSSMFGSCSSLTTVDVSNFNTRNVQSMVGMFSLCTSLKELDLSSFNTSKVTQMTAMFSNCTSLEKLDLSNFNTSNVLSMSMMFYACNKLNSITLGIGFTKWENEAYLPTGNWTNGTITKTETGLYSEYPTNASAWAGTWTKIIPVSSIQLNTYSASIERGDSISIVATVIPSNATVNTVSWSSSNTAVATVDQNGLVTAIAGGTAVITVNANDDSGVYTTCNITVIVNPSCDHSSTETLKVNNIDPTCTSDGGYDIVVHCTKCDEIISTERVIVPALGHEWDEGTITKKPTFSSTGIMEYKCLRCGETKQENMEKGTVINISVGDEARIDISLQQNEVTSLVSETPQIVNANIVSVGTSYSSTIRYTRGIQVIGDTAGFGKIAINVGDNLYGYIYRNVSSKKESIIEEVGFEKTIILKSCKYLVYYISNPDIDFSAKKELKMSSIDGGTYTAYEYTSTLTLVFNKPIIDDNVVIYTNGGDVVYLDINITQHEWNEPVYEWSYDNRTVTATRTCKNGDHPEIETVETTAIIVKQPSCVENGQTKYIAEFENTGFTTQIKIEEDIPAIGHEWNEPTYTWSGDYLTCKAERMCARDQSHYEYEYANVTEYIVEPTCTESGSASYTAEFINPAFETQYLSFYAGDALGHAYGDWKYDGEDVKTHTRVCDNDPSHKETEPCQFDEGIVDGDTTTYTCKVCGGTYTVKEEGPVTPVVSGITRVAGGNRFGTSFAISDTILMNSGNEKHDCVILANGDNFADALAGSYLAAVKNAPIIITRAAKIAEVNAYIKSVLVKGGTIYVLGGPAAVPESSLNGLSGYKIKRLAGNNRYGTNLEILKEAGVEGDTILIATGTNYADSLSASATGLPMLLVKGLDSLNDEQKAFLKENKGKKFVVLGGTGAVSSSIENELKKYGEVERIAGDNRFATSIKIAEYFFAEADTAVLAYGSDFPDGLCGGPLAYQVGAPLILTRNDKTDIARPYTKARNITDGYALGGTSVLPDATVRKLFGAGNDVPIKQITH